MLGEGQGAACPAQPLPGGLRGAAVSITVAWMFPNSAEARRTFGPGSSEQTGSYDLTGHDDPAIETRNSKSYVLTGPDGSMSESVVIAGPVLFQLTSTSRRALRLLTPLLRNLLDRYAPGTVMPPAPQAGWSFPADEPISKVVAVDGSVYAGGGGDYYALNAETGALRWSRQIGMFADSAVGPVAADGAVHVASGNRVVALDGATGRTRWSHRLEWVDGLAVGSRTVYAWTHDTQMVAFDTASGRTRWTARPSASIDDVIPHPAGDLVYVTDSGGWWRWMPGRATRAGASASNRAPGRTVSP
ncbi:PQQ-binding-like beta-propeller repeat protein [Nonomuraea sp. NPDC059007]|uniref:outer membrane protein assembly factor BamB family protein n=1 Tax=Nonomuraea sp. NPDC059007 TaxID=3346692 RepID=UPI00368CCF79